MDTRTEALLVVDSMWSDMKMLGRLLHNLHTNHKQLVGQFHDFANLYQHEEPLMNPLCDNVEDVSLDEVNQDKELVIGKVSATEMAISNVLYTDIPCIAEVQVPYADAKHVELSSSDIMEHCDMSCRDEFPHFSAGEICEL